MFIQGANLKTKKRISLFMVIAILFSMISISCFPMTTVSASGNTYYVSVTGDDTLGTGSIDNPFRTIQRAANIMSPGDTCIIREGVYRETVAPPVSGTADAPIVFKAYEGETVTISGAEAVVGWSVYSDSIYVADMDWDLGDQNQIFVNGDMMTEARWPNNTGTLLEPVLGVVDSSTNTSITDSDLNHEDNFFAGAKIWAVGGSGYLAKTATVTGSSGNTITFDSNSFYDGYRPSAGDKYYFFGKLNLLDAENEWYYDSTESKLYLYAPNGADPSTLEVEAKKRMVAIDLSNRSHIIFDGINVFSATVTTNNQTNNCTIKNATLRYLSHSNNMDDFWAAQHNYGIRLSGTNNEINSCTIQYSSSSLISLSGNGNRIINCLASDANYAGSAFGLINITGSNHLISHNTLTNAGRSIIYARAGISNLDIGYNDISHAGRLTKDIGIIYIVNTDGHNTRIHHNWVHDNDTEGVGHGIYLDNYTYNFIVDHNVVWNGTGGDGSALSLNTPSENNLVYNNTLFDGGIGYWGRGLYKALQDRTRIFNNIYGKEIRSGTAVLGNNVKITDPSEFVDAANKDFRLKADSSAIDSGVEIPGITDGFTGAAPDCGAYEYGISWRAGHDFSNVPSPSFEGVETTYLNRVVNGGFEYNNFTGWTKTGAQTAQIIYGDAWEYPNLDALCRSQLYGLRLGTGQDGVEQVITGLQPNTEYLLSAWGKVTSGDDTLAIGVKDFGGNEIYEEINDTAWTNKIITFTTGPANTTATVYFKKTGGSGYAYCDDMAVQVFDPASIPPVVNEDWGKHDGALVVNVKDGVSISGGFSAYLKRTYFDETLSFDLTTDLTDAWPAIGVRVQSVSQPLWGTTGYGLVFAGGRIELQKYGFGILAQIEDSLSIYDGSTKNVTISAVNEGEAVRIRVTIGGEEIFNYLDETNPILDAGYFHVHANVNPVIITNFRVITPGGTPGISLTGPGMVEGPEKTFNLTYGLTGAEDITAQDITIVYDEDLFEFVDAQPILSGITIADMDIAEGAVRLILASQGPQNAVNGDADVLNLSFKSKAGGTGSIAITGAVLANSEGAEFSPEVTGISIEVADMNKEELIQAINRALEIYNNAVEGIQTGQYPVGLKERLNSAIVEAMQVRDNENATAGQILQAIADLNEAVDRFQSLIITDATGDVNNDGRISLGDLGIVAANYGKTSEDSGWNAIRHMDINDDGEIGLYELAFIARRLLQN